MDFTLSIILGVVLVAYQVLDFLGHKSIRPSTLVWNAFFVGVLCFLFTWRAWGYIDMKEAAFERYIHYIFLAGILSSLRNPLLRLIESFESFTRLLIYVLRDGLAIIIGAACAWFAIDRPWNTSVFEEHIPSVIFTICIIAVVMLCAYALFQRNGIGPALVAVACCILGIVQYFVLEFKGAAITPSDVLSLQTAAAVGDQYTYELSHVCVQTIALTCVSLMLFSFVCPARIPLTKKVENSAPSLGKHNQATGQKAIKTKRVVHIPGILRLLANVVCNLAASALIASALWGWLNSVSILDFLHVGFDYWTPLNTYVAYGFIPSFGIMWQDLNITKPDNYSDEQAQADEEELAAIWESTRGASAERAAAEAQFSELQPTIIAVMDESFSDLSVFDCFTQAGYTGPTFEKYGLTDALKHGSLWASTHGGGTCNTEFEFLTGNSLAFIGTGKYPYILYDFDNVSALPHQLEELGYTSTAVHPASATNWNRNEHYESFGFEEFLDIEDSEQVDGAYTVHAGYSDETTYWQVLDLLENDASPQFIFDVTLQNHSAYTTVTFAEEDQVNTVPAGVDDESLQTSIVEYLSCIQSSDEQLERFVDELRQLDRPVVLVYFGDHQPNFTRDLNDLLYQDDDSFVHEQRLYESSYFVWANYEIAGATTGVDFTSTGANTLAAKVLDLIGAPLTEYQKAQLGASQEIVALNVNGYLGADGTWYELDAESAYVDTIEKWRRMQYMEFAEKVQTGH